MLRIIVDSEGTVNIGKTKQILNGSEIALEVMPFSNGRMLTIWDTQDVKNNTSAKGISDEELLEFLEACENHTCNDMIEKGWENIEELFGVYGKKIA